MIIIILEYSDSFSFSNTFQQFDTPYMEDFVWQTKLYSVEAHTNTTIPSAQI
jgi:hypothetical protein